MLVEESVSSICELFGKSRQAWYDNHKRLSDHQLEHVFILTLVKEIRKDHKRMGTDKLYHEIKPMLNKHAIKCGRDKLHSLLNVHGMLVRHRWQGARTTNSNHLYRKYPNLIRDMVLMQPNRLWVSDITYIRTKYGFVYLSLVTDAYSKKIVGWCLWPNLSSEGALNALKMATNEKTFKNGLTHHSDRGIQYCCYDYVNYLKGSEIKISMTENGDPYENAIAERVNGILKDEYDLYDVFDDYLTANEAVKRAVNLYNDKRPHASIDFRTPNQAHIFKGKLKNRWKKECMQKEEIETLV
jgi:transposase InsO family protein